MEAKVLHPKDNTKTAIRQVPADNTDQKVIPLPGSFPRNQMDLHFHFLAERGQDIKWCVEKQSWFIWNGKHWECEEDDHGKLYGWLKRYIVNLLPRAGKIKDDEQRKKAAEFAALCQRDPAALIPAIMRLCRNEVAVSLNDFDTDEWLLNVQNGTLELRTGTLREHRREDMISRIAAAPFVPGETCPTWDDLMQWACLGDAEFVAYKQRMMGSFLTGSTRDHFLGIDYGDGGNGKSTQYGMLQRLLGKYAVSMRIESLMTSTKRSGNETSEDIMALKGARMAIASEGEEGQRLAAGLNKLLTGGDIIPARPLYGRQINFKASHKLVIFTNNKPSISDMSNGMWRRVRLVPSLANIDEDAKAGKRQKLDEDAMTMRLDAEMSGILNWLVAGCLAWQAQGLGTCAAVDRATQEYHDEMDIIGSFLTDFVAVTTDVNNVTCADLYKAFSLYCDESNQGAVKKPRFEAYIKKHKHLWTETRNYNIHYWCGLDKIKYTAMTPTPVAPPAPVDRLPESPAQATLEQYTASGVPPAPAAPLTLVQVTQEQHAASAPTSAHMQPTVTTAASATTIFAEVAEEAQKLLDILPEVAGDGHGSVVSPVQPSVQRAIVHYVAIHQPAIMVEIDKRHSKTLSGIQLFNALSAQLRDPERVAYVKGVLTGLEAL